MRLTDSELLRELVLDGLERSGPEDLPETGASGEVVERIILNTETPPFKIANQVTLVDLSPRLARCIAIRATAIGAFGWKVLPRRGLDLVNSPKDLAVFEAERKDLEDFLEAASDSLEEAVMAVATDEETMGNGYLVAVRAASGTLTRLEHLPGRDVLLLRHDKGGKPRGFVQARGGKVRYFKPFGEPRAMDALTGLYADELAALAAAGNSAVDPALLGVLATTDQAVNRKKALAETVAVVREAAAVLKADDGVRIPPERRAAEVVHFRLYSPASTYYGVPRWRPATKEVVGGHYASLRNLVFFKNDGTPRTAVVLSGGTLSKESRKQVTEMFEEQKGVENAGRLVILEMDRGNILTSTGSNPKVEIVPLTVGVTEDASFLKYMADTRRVIAELMGFPESFFSESGTNKATAFASMRRVDEQELEPSRKRYGRRLTRTIVRALGLSHVHLVFNGPDLVDLKELSEAIRNLATAAAITPDDAREMLGRQPYPDDAPWARVPLPIAVVQQNRNADGGGSPAPAPEDAPDAPEDAPPDTSPEDVVAAARPPARDRVVRGARFDSFDRPS